MRLPAVGAASDWTRGRGLAHWHPGIHGLHTPRFAQGDEAFDFRHVRSVERVAGEWLAAFKQTRLLN
jgi:hypothetical protein